MSLITTLARVEACEAGRARPLTTVRHRHLAERPLVLVPLTTAGEVGAPLGALVGTDRSQPRLLVVPQPRDRDLRFAFLAELADAVVPYLESAQDSVEYEQRKETDPETGKKVPVEVELCTDAPQLLVPNESGVEYVRLLGRSMRFRRTAEQDPDTPYPAPPQVPLLGRWLTHYGERARVPGSALLLSMTGLLGRHWATGQSRLEDQHLGALLAWIRPPQDGESGAAAALRVERQRDRDGVLLVPPAGPATDPAFDNARLAPAIARYDAAGHPAARGRAAEEIRKLVASQLFPTWEAMWQGIELLRALPEGSRVAGRWKRDRWSYTGHRDRLRAGEPPQPRHDDAVTAARKLAARETAQAQLEADEALDDPLVMAGRRLAGEAFAGEVTGVRMAFSEGKRPMPRPLITVRTADSPRLSAGMTVYRVLEAGESDQKNERKTQTGEFVGFAGTEADRCAAPAGPAAEPGEPPREPRTERQAGPHAPEAAVPQAGAARAADSGNTDPHSTGPHSTHPDNAGPHSTGPHSTTAGNTDPHNTGTHSTHPHTTHPDNAGPDNAGPHSTGAGITGPDSTHPHSTRPDSAAPRSTGAGTDAAAGRVEGRVLADTGGGAGCLVVVRLTGGMGRGKVPGPGSVPAEGDQVCWTLFEHAPRGGPELPGPEDIPWTHGGPVLPDLTAGPEPDPVTSEDAL